MCGSITIGSGKEYNNFTIRPGLKDCFLFGFILMLLVVFNAPVKASPYSEQDATADTALVKQLFSKGYEFIDGPSDSLLYYFDQAHIIIKKNLEKLKDHPGSEFRSIFKRLEWRVNIEFGIEHFFKSDYNIALEYFRNSLEIAKELDEAELLSESYSEIGIVLKNQGNLDEALEYYEQALHYAGMDTDSSWIASCQVNLGNAYKEKGFLIISLEYYLDALKTLETLGHTRRLAACYQNMGEVSGLQNDHKQAKIYHTRALELASEAGDEMRVASCRMNLGYLHAEKAEYEQAREYYDQAMAFFEKSGYTHEIDDCYILIGDTWLGEGNTDLAISHYNLAVEISRQEEDHRKLSEIYCKLGQAFLQQGNLNLAEQYCRKSLEKARLTSYLEIERNVHQVLSRLYMSKGDLERSYMHFREQSVLKDSIFNEHKYSALAELQVKYETEKKEQQIALYSEQAEVQRLKITQRNRMLIAIAAVSLLLLILSYLLIRQNRLRAKQKAIELEQKLLRSQMNPHFIFNSLIAIQSFIYSKDALQAGDYLAKFAELVRHTLLSSRTELIALEKEVDMMKVYLELQKLRFEDHFDYNLEVDEPLKEDFYIPPMFAQPFVENAIEHGLRHRESGGMVSIWYRKANKHTLMITVKDNGIGRKASAGLGEKSGHRSMGITITEERLSILSKRYGQKFELRNIDLMNEAGENSGLEVQIDIPLRETLNQ